MSHLVAIPTYCIAYFSLLTSSLLAWVVEPRKLYLNSFLVIERDPGPGPMSRSHPGSRHPSRTIFAIPVPIPSRTYTKRDPGHW